MRKPEYLRQQYAAILSSVGVILLLSAAVMLTPLLVLSTWPEQAEYAPAFMLPAGCCALSGLVLWLLFSGSPDVTISVKEGGVIVLLSWSLVILFVVLMLIGGGTCSTAGGIKQFRIYLFWRLILWEIRRALLPRSAVFECPLWEGNRRIFVDDARVRQVAVFVFLYMATFMAGVMLLCAYGYSLRDSLFEFASALGTVGLSVGVTSAQMPAAALWAETLAMFLGRLEFMVVIVTLLKLGRDGGQLFAGRPKRISRYAQENRIN